MVTGLAGKGHEKAVDTLSDDLDSLRGLDLSDGAPRVAFDALFELLAAGAIFSEIWPLDEEPDQKWAWKCLLCVLCAEAGLLLVNGSLNLEATAAFLLCALG